MAARIGLLAALLALAAAPVLGATLSLARLAISDGRGATVDATPVPGQGGQVYLLELHGGRITVTDGSTDTEALSEIVIDGVAVTAGANRGAYSITLAPDFTSTGKLYVSVAIRTPPANGTPEQAKNVVVEYTANPQTLLIDPASQRKILTIAAPGSGADGHFGSAISFGPEGNLFVTTGDRNGPFGPSSGNPAQDPTSLFGKVLRIDVGGDDFTQDPENNYAIPAGNPDFGPGADPALYAIGLRNPFKGKFSALCQCMLIGDVGEKAFEEINLLAPGANYEWDVREGPQPTGGAPGPGTPTAPLYAYDRAPGPFGGLSVTGGLVYSGNTLGALTGRYIFGDFGNPSQPETSPIWSFLPDPGNGTVSELTRYDVLASGGLLNAVIGFGQSGAGDLYLFDLDGDVFRVAAASSAVPLPAAFGPFAVALALGAGCRRLRRGAG